MEIFHSYVSLPEGIHSHPICPSHPTQTLDNVSIRFLAGASAGATACGLTYPSLEKTPPDVCECLEDSDATIIYIYIYRDIRNYNLYFFI